LRRQAATAKPAGPAPMMTVGIVFDSDASPGIVAWLVCGYF
jgi:hypothetical protein